MKIGSPNFGIAVARTVLNKKRKIPDRLYKYRSFDNRTLDLLVADNLFFADPSTFNDPLDTKPSLSTDLGADALENIFGRLLEQRISAEMKAAAKTIKYRGPKTLDHIERHSRKLVDQEILNIRYHADNPDYEFEDPDKFLFGRYIEDELLRRYEKGVVSLAESSVCPLMWSHYGDQHKGICIGYSIPEKVNPQLYKIKYGGSRLIKASTVAAMLGGDDAARQKIDQAVLSRKARDWRYEREWRLIGPREIQASPLELEEVVFGMRCSATVKYAVIKALSDRSRAVKFYEIRERSGEFILSKNELGTSELLVTFPRRSLDVYDQFQSFRDGE